jgi:hypothetical protein
MQIKGVNINSLTNVKVTVRNVEKGQSATFSGESQGRPCGFLCRSQCNVNAPTLKFVMAPKFVTVFHARYAGKGR